MQSYPPESPDEVKTLIPAPAAFSNFAAITSRTAGVTLVSHRPQLWLTIAFGLSAMTGSNISLKSVVGVVRL